MRTFAELHTACQSVVRQAIARGAQTVTVSVSTPDGEFSQSTYSLPESFDRLTALLPISIAGGRVQAVASFDNEKAAGAWTLALPEFSGWE